MQSVSCLRTSAFCGSTVHPAAARASGVASRAPVVVRAVQNLQGTVVSTAMNKTVVVAVERLAPHDKVRGAALTQQRRSSASRGSACISSADCSQLAGVRCMGTWAGGPYPYPPMRHTPQLQHIGQYFWARLAHCLLHALHHASEGSTSSASARPSATWRTLRTPTWLLATTSSCLAAGHSARTSASPLLRCCARPTKHLQHGAASAAAAAVVAALHSKCGQSSWCSTSQTSVQGL